MLLINQEAESMAILFFNYQKQVFFPEKKKKKDSQGLRSFEICWN